MPCFPPPGSVTICEINRDLITAENLSDERAKETYGKILGTVFSPISLMAYVEPADNEQGGEQEGGDLVLNAGASSLLTVVHSFFNRMLQLKNLNLTVEVDGQRVSWHPNKHILAFISGHNEVIIQDYEDKEGQGRSILRNESLGGIKTLEWRPKSGRMLAVGCSHGICLWSASYPGNPASIRPGVSTLVGNVSGGSRLRWTLVDLLRNPDYDEDITSLSWSPTGRFLASASGSSSSFMIWDVAQGLGTPVRRGLGKISMLKWSPSGDYFFMAKSDGSFYLWETNTWTSEQWSSIDGCVTGATWDPNGQMILLAFSESSTLGSIYFSSRPPSLDAHLLPVELPEFVTIGSDGIDKIAWDASGERLAVSYKGGNENYCGLIAIYDVRRGPLISASLVGFIRGPGEKPQPLTFAFHNRFLQGPLLSVCWSSGWCCTYPLMFRSNILP